MSKLTEISCGYKRLWKKIVALKAEVVELAKSHMKSKALEYKCHLGYAI